MEPILDRGLFHSLPRSRRRRSRPISIKLVALLAAVPLAAGVLHFLVFTDDPFAAIREPSKVIRAQLTMQRVAERSAAAASTPRFGVDALAHSVFRALCPLFHACFEETAVVSATGDNNARPAPLSPGPVAPAPENVVAYAAPPAPAPVAAQTPATASSTTSTASPQATVVQYVTQPVIERSGISEGTFNSRIALLKNELVARIASSGAGGSSAPAAAVLSSDSFVSRDFFNTQVDAIYDSMEGTADTDDLSGVTITDATITGGSVEASSLTGTITNAINSIAGTIASLGGTELTYTRAAFTSATTSNLAVTSLAAGAGAYLAVNPDGTVIATSTPTTASSTLLSDTNHWTGGNVFTNATTTSLHVTSLTNALLGTDGNGRVVSTTTISAGLLTGSLGTVNSTAFNRGDNITVTAASSTLLGDTNNFSALTKFTSGLTSFASTTIGGGTQATGLTISGGATTTGSLYIAGTVTAGDLSIDNKLAWDTSLGQLNISYTAGNTGIGINGSTGQLLLLNDGANGVLRHTSAGSLYFDSAGTGGDTIFRNSASIIETMRITSFGNVGVGTTSPTNKLEVQGGAFFGGNVIATGTVQSSATAANTFPYASSTALTVSGAAHFPGSGIWNASGNVGIGTTTPGAALHITSNTKQIRFEQVGGAYGGELSWDDTYGTILRSTSALNTTTFQPMRLDFYALTLQNRNGAIAKFDENGNVGIGTTTPPSRLTIQNGSAGSGAAASANAAIFVDANATSYLQFGVPTNSSAGILFGDYGQNNIGSIVYSNANDTLTFAANPGLVVTQTSTGFGVGTTTPDAKLQVAGKGKFGYDGAGADFVALDLYAYNPSDGAQFMFEVADTGISGLTPKNLVIHGTSGSSDIAFSPSTSYPGLLMLDGSSGVVGVGTVTPNEGKVEVKGGSVCVDTNSDNTASSCIANESDERLKTNIQPISASTSLDAILALNPVSFDWRIDDPDVLSHYSLISRFAGQPHSIGLIAQEVMPVLPEALSLETVGDDEVQYFQLDYTKFIPHLIGAIKQLWARVQEYFARTETLEAELASLKAEVASLKAHTGAAGASADDAPAPSEEDDAAQSDTEPQVSTDDGNIGAADDGGPLDTAATTSPVIADSPSIVPDDAPGKPETDEGLQDQEEEVDQEALEPAEASADSEPNQAAEGATAL